MLCHGYQRIDWIISIQESLGLFHDVELHVQKKPAFELAKFVDKRGFKIETDKGFIPFEENDTKGWLALAEG